MKKAIIAALATLVLALPAHAADKKAGKPKPSKQEIANPDDDALMKLAKKKGCKQLITYREVLPFFGKETTKQASKEITIQFEKEDIAAGRAEILESKSECIEMLGTFFVTCTTDTTLCYFQPRDQAPAAAAKADDKGKKKTKQKTAKAAKTKKAKEKK